MGLTRPEGRVMSASKLPHGVYKSMNKQDKVQELPAVATPQPTAHVHGPHCNHGPTHAPFVRPNGKVGRNDPCPCGSTQKYKKCHGQGL